MLFSFPLFLCYSVLYYSFIYLDGHGTLLAGYGHGEGGTKCLAQRQIEAWGGFISPSRMWCLVLVNTGPGYTGHLWYAGHLLKLRAFYAAGPRPVS